MHAVLITYQSAVEPEALGGALAAHARAIAAAPGLVAKTWLRDGATLGGFYLFADRAAADAYLDGALVAALAAHPAFAQFTIRHYRVLEELSRITGSPPPGAVARKDGLTAADDAGERREAVARGVGADEAHQMMAALEGPVPEQGEREH